MLCLFVFEVFCFPPSLFLCPSHLSPLTTSLTAHRSTLIPPFTHSHLTTHSLLLHFTSLRTHTTPHSLSLLSLRALPSLPPAFDLALRCLSMPPHWVLPSEPQRFRTLETRDQPLRLSACSCHELQLIEMEENAERRLLEQREELVTTLGSLSLLQHTPHTRT